METLILQNAQILNPGELTPHTASVVIENGAFSAILPMDAPLPEGEVLDATGKLLIPGLINAHTHSHANLLRGLCDAWSLEMSLTNGSWMAGPRDPDAIYTSTLLGALEMLSQGVTMCYDLVFEFPAPTVEGIAAVVQAYKDAGMRALVTPMIADRTFFEAIPGLLEHLVEAGVAPGVAASLGDGNATLAACEKAFASVDWTPGQVEPAIAPTIALHCTEDFMRGCQRLAKAFDLRMHMHVAESRVQAQAALDEYGRPFTAELERLGLLGPKFTAAHGVWLHASDFRRMAATGTSLVHMPGSNLRLGCGIAAIREALDYGVTVGLATDGANSSDSLSMFRAMNLAAMVSRAWGRPPREWLRSADVFGLATSGSAAVMGRAHDLGRIAEGYRADAVLLDLSTIAFTPTGETLNQLVNAESGSAVERVMVDGKWVWSDGGPLRFDATLARNSANSLVGVWRNEIAEQRADAERRVGPVVDYAQSYGARFDEAKRYL